MADQLLLTDREGNGLAFLEPNTLAITRQWCGGATLEATLDTRDPKTSRLEPGAAALQWWLDDDLRFNGQVGEPLTTDAANVMARASDPWETLQARKLQADEAHVSTDAGAIASGSVTTENGRAPTGLQVGTIAATTPRNITFPKDTTRADLITQLSQLDGGFGFTLDAVAGVPNVYAELNVYAPTGTHGFGRTSGVGAYRADLPDVRFEYGDGTLDNCDGFTEELLRPRNRIIATGQSLPDGTRPQMVAEDTDSQDEYGLWEYEVSVDTTSTGVLYAHALAELRPAPVASYTLTPTPDAPFLFRDFDVGNTVRLTIAHGRVDVTGTARVDACTIKRDAGDWRIDSLTLTSPLVQRISTGPSYLLPALLTKYRDRIALLERTRVVGS